MNPLTLVRRTQNINAKEAELGISDEASWHANYKDSAYVFVGGIPYDLTEGDLLAVFAQYGEIVDVNLVREKSTGKSKGFAFVAYEDQRSTTLSVDNLNGAQIAGRTIRVDHVANYKKKEEEDEETERQKREERGVCRAFQRGECKYGDSCKFSHDEQRAANTGWGPEEERKARSALDKLDKRATDNKRSRDAPPSRAPEEKRHDAYDKPSFAGKKITKSDEDIGDRAKRAKYEDRDERNVERSSRYEPESKKSRDPDEKDQIKTKRHDTQVRDSRGERYRDRSRDRGRDKDRDDVRAKDGERKKQSSSQRDYPSKDHRDREIEDSRQGRRDDDYHRSRR